MLIVTFVTFALLNLLPGDVSLELLGSDATPSAIARVRAELRLDDPLVVRYMRWLGQALHGDLGRSFITGEPFMAALARTPGVDRVDGAFASAFAFACSSCGHACCVPGRTIYRQAAFRACRTVAFGAELHAWAGLDVLPGADSKMAPRRRLRAALGGNSPT